LYLRYFRSLTCHLFLAISILVYLYNPHKGKADMIKIILVLLLLLYIVPKLPYWLTNRCSKHKIKKSLIWEGIETNLNLCPVCHDPSIVKLNNNINRQLGL